MASYLRANPGDGDPDYRADFLAFADRTAQEITYTFPVVRADGSIDPSAAELEAATERNYLYLLHCLFPSGFPGKLRMLFEMEARENKTRGLKHGSKVTGI